MGVPANPNNNRSYVQYSQTPAPPGATVAYNYNSPSQGNPYVATGSATSYHPPRRGAMDKVVDAFDKCGKKLDDVATKAEEYMGNLWQHLKIGPSLADTAMGRIAQGTKVLTEGGYENVFKHTFDAFPGEKLQSAYACYLSTSAGPVIGTLYVSNMRLAFCSDNPLAYTPSPGQTQWSYYKVVIPFYDLKAANPSANRMNPSEKYIQIITADGHEFWFMGFVSYDKALKHLQDVLRNQAVEIPHTQ
eukprot:TRINITY_DN29052_c0_g1_i1.p1 TRINITY_DN29052_c0_g1~~TRINITY_DN29052_c0_g1_i1.p1  ORF type:complete len:246 (-),score=28.23 TRINITY_DN29052_c0_g1_i1:123-860(-)